MLTWAENAAAEELIDPLENLEDSRVYILSGTEDTIIVQKVVEQNELFYSLAGTPVSMIKGVYELPAEHGWITVGYDVCW